MILPASGQEHGLLDEDRARQQDVPAASNVVRAGRQKRETISTNTTDYNGDGQNMMTLNSEKNKELCKN